MHDPDRSRQRRELAQHPLPLREDLQNSRGDVLGQERTSYDCRGMRLALRSFLRVQQGEDLVFVVLSLYP